MGEDVIPSRGEPPLAGGRITEGVVRVGDTVRRPTGPHSVLVHDLLRLFEAKGLACVPRLLGVDGDGREVLTFLHGWVPPNLEWRRWRDEQVVAAARIVRELHDATAGSGLTVGAEGVCHGDLSPCNFVFVDGLPRYVIDFDAAYPGTRRQDLAYMAWMWLVGREDSSESPPFRERLRQMRLLLDTYGLEDREDFAEAIHERQRVVRTAMIGRGSPPSWVEDEIAFVAGAAAEINAAT